MEAVPRMAISRVQLLRVGVVLTAVLLGLLATRVALQASSSLQLGGISSYRSVSEIFTRETSLWLMEDLVGTESLHMGLPGLAALAVFVNPLVEVVPRIRQDGDTKRLPLLPFSAMTIQCMVWLVYGALIQAPGVMCPNIFGLALGLYYWWVFHRHCPQGADWLPSTASVHAIGGVATLAVCCLVPMVIPRATAASALGCVGMGMSLLMVGGPLASAKTVLEEKSTRSLPFGFTCCLAANAILWTIYGHMVSDPMIYVPNTIGVIISFVQLALFAVFGIHAPTKAT